METDPTHSPCSSTPSASKTSCSNQSLSDNSDEKAGRVKEREKTPEKIPEKRKNSMCQTFPKVDRRFSWRKSPPCKQSSIKPQQAPFTTHKAESDITCRILSAQIRKVKELKDELCDVQRTLEATNRENRLLTRLQHIHMKALQKYESPEGSIHHLIARHCSEVRTLRENLRTTQESERGLSLKLRVAESELLKAKDNLWRLQRLAEDKNLAEREELNKKLSSLLIKMEIDSTKIKVLDKQLHLMDNFYDRQLAMESKKTSEAYDTSRKLQEDILSLQQTIKKKDRELHIKNIYSHRMPRNIWKYGSVYSQRGLMFTRSTQTESGMVTQDQLSAHEGEEYGERQDKNIESENDSSKKEDNSPEMTSEEAPTHDVLAYEEKDDFLEIDEKYKEQNKESSTEGPNRPLLERDLGQGDTRHYEKNKLETVSTENKVDSKKRANDTRSYLPKLSRDYIFTAATENLHQGLPASGPIPSLSKAHSCKILHRDSSLGHEELSLPKIKTGKEKIGKCPGVSLSNRKNNLNNELVGTGYGVENSI
ncbi:lebercilin-like protein isoform X2 [Dendropsophus ebraccatus]|uniref:lebercilin-like protein isoform X2 n=1 Tax=Dendropsophus ebraccatus TaxID=150705 RepID=UPI003831F416